MVTREELQNDEDYADICEDVKDECSQHGEVAVVLIPRIKEGFPAQCEGGVYVQFLQSEAAQRAAMALTGRKFADNTVDVDYFDESAFASRNLL